MSSWPGRLPSHSDFSPVVAEPTVPQRRRLISRFTDPAFAISAADLRPESRGLPAVLTASGVPWSGQSSSRQAARQRARQVRALLAAAFVLSGVAAGAWLAGALTATLVLGTAVAVAFALRSTVFTDAFRAVVLGEQDQLLHVRFQVDGTFVWTLAPSHVVLSPTACALLSLQGQQDECDWLSWIEGADRPVLDAAVQDVLAGRQSQLQVAVRFVRPGVPLRWVELRATAERDRSGRPLRLIGWLIDATERQQTEERLRHEALHDALTGLPNRTRAVHQLSHAMARHRHDPSYNWAVLFLDLDHFKLVNDSQGHQAGDRLLQELAARLTIALAHRGMVARISGDEFLVIVQGTMSTLEVRTLAMQLVSSIQHGLESPLTIEGREWDARVSIGVVVGEARYRAPEEVLRDADTAMYAAKEQGRGGARLFDQSMHDRVLRRLDTERNLRDAVTNDWFVLEYQPVLDTSSGALLGLEALVRMRHPTRGMLGPGEFIEVAEETGIIVPVTQWVVRTACQDLAMLQQCHPDYARLWVNVNASGRCFEQRDFVEQVMSAIADAGIATETLRVEITETVLVQGAEQTAQTMRELTERGVALILDDFGTGYSSLSYLHRFPLKGLKIDRSFVSRLHEESSRQLVATMITLATHLRLVVTAEGIETELQLRELQDLKCSQVQGYALGRPVALREIVSRFPGRRSAELDARFFLPK
ncbi:MAG: EAL domain-containing protein [Myxococcales bacterium]|nr:EAL domain-containing protein [Myxococcales bacterium]